MRLSYNVAKGETISDIMCDLVRDPDIPIGKRSSYSNRFKVALSGQPNGKLRLACEAALQELEAYPDPKPMLANRRLVIKGLREALISSPQQAPVDTAVQTKTSLSVGERCAEKITAFLATPESRSFWATDDCSEIAAIINQEVNKKE